MSDYTLRNVKGSELTFSEVDNNFIASRTSGRFSNNSLLEPISGLFFSQSATPVTFAGRTPGADTIELSPICLGYTTQIDQVGVWKSAGASTEDFRILIYSAGSDNLPSSKVAETATITNASGAGDNNGALSYTFSANTLYWVGMHIDAATASYQCIPANDMRSLGFTAMSALSSGTISNAIQLTGVSLGSAPSTWTFASSQLVNVAVPAIGFRVA